MNKIFILIVVVALSTFNAYSQITFDKKDEFTGKRIKGATVAILKPSLSTMVMENLIFADQDGKKYLMLNAMMPSGTFNPVAANDISKMSLLVKLEGDSVLRFPALPTSTVNEGAYSSVNIVSEIADDRLAILASRKISAVRWAFKEDDYGLDLKITDKTKNEFQKAAAYMLKNN